MSMVNVGVAGVIVSIVGAIASIVAIPPRMHRRTLVILLCSVLLVLSCGMLVSALTIGPEPPPPPMTTGAFTSPPPDERETSRDFLTVAGSVEGLPSTSGLLCIVKDDLPRYYPWYTAAVANGQWSVDVGISPASIDRQKRFTLILATATQSAVEELGRLQEANPGDDYYKNGLPKLPDGIQELDKIVIVRTP